MSKPARMLRLFLAALLIAAGCSGVQVRKAVVFVCLCDRTERLVDSHVLSDFTCEVLRQNGLSVAAAKHDPAAAISELRALTQPCSRDPARQLALAELCYRHARKLDSLLPAPSLPWYRDSACWAVRAAAAGDPSVIEQATDIHNRSIERMVRLSQDIRCRRGRNWPAVFAEAGVQLAAVTPFLDPPPYESLTVARDIVARGMEHWYANDGFGVPLVAYRANERTDPAGRFFPYNLHVGATAVMHPDVGGMPTLVFHDPFAERTVAIGETSAVLATDRTAALASHFAWGYFRSLARLGLRRSEAFQPDAGLRLFRPYQPGRIPVVLIHGLRSTPTAAWVQTFNFLQNDPKLADRYQFWLFTYPTGAPLAANAARLRSDLRDALATFDPGGNDPALRRMVLVGHSMGGLIAKMVAQDSGTAMWDSFFAVPPDQLRMSEVSRRELVESLFYQAEPSAGRLVFVATPHEGTKAANGLLGRLVESKIFRQDSFEAAVRDVRRENGKAALAPDVNVRRLDGIGGLRPGAPALSAAAELPIEPGVPYHSIIPQLGFDDFHLATDGLVKYRSSHIDGAESELIVTGGHRSTDTPQVANEIRRILLEHLAVVDGPSSR